VPDVFLLDSLLVGGLRFVLEKVADIADRELNDPDRWRAMLLESQLAYENGEITAEELAEHEREILARLRELHPEASGVVLSSDDLEGVDVIADIDDSPRARR
jgi:Gas vesicle protein G